jgi:tryptophanyl-tRNA synthetase
MSDKSSFGLTGLTDHQRNLFGSVLPPRLLDLVESGRGLEQLDFSRPEKHYLYTGRGPSGGSFHVGHLPSYQLTLELGRAFSRRKIFFMLSDDEKIFRGDVSPEEAKNNVASTLSQLRSLGFSESNTEFHLNSDGLSKEHYAIVMRLLQLVNVNQLEHLFGQKGNLGEYFYPLVQLFPCFLDGDGQCVVVAGRDQDPFFRLARDLARRIGSSPPVVIYTKTLPGLDGSEKMSTSVPSSVPIFLTDPPVEVERKIKKIRQVGAGTLDELFERGADLSRDVPYQISLFFQQDPEVTELVKTAYTVGLSDKERGDRLTLLVGQKGVATRNEKTMLTSHGIRVYLTRLIVDVLAAFGT